MATPHASIRTYTSLTDRERATLTLAADGLLAKEIAAALGTTTSTLKNRLAGINQKLGTANRIEAIAAAIQLGEIPCPYCKSLHHFSHRAVKDRKRR